MKKLKLNKEAISQMDRNEMTFVKGGGEGFIDISICFVSCKNGSKKGKKCCDW
ncbi:class I lanthipeptide [Aquimarina algiphila]|uniref:class I lanthipeptide n=1 Tax=Aquimarina algiphila TaxID=2047982 RepID=UPI0024900685|nr:class I lanthipeptide [Aquimarina algiphila]